MKSRMPFKWITSKCCRRVTLVNLDNNPPRNLKVEEYKLKSKSWWLLQASLKKLSGSSCGSNEVNQSKSCDKNMDCQLSMHPTFRFGFNNSTWKISPNRSMCMAVLTLVKNWKINPSPWKSFLDKNWGQFYSSFWPTWFNMFSQSKIEPKIQKQRTVNAIL